MSGPVLVSMEQLLNTPTFETPSVGSWQVVEVGTFGVSSNYPGPGDYSDYSGLLIVNSPSPLQPRLQQHPFQVVGGLPYYFRFYSRLGLGLPVGDSIKVGLYDAFTGELKSSVQCFTVASAWQCFGAILIPSATQSVLIRIEPPQFTLHPTSGFISGQVFIDTIMLFRGAVELGGDYAYQSESRNRGKYHRTRQGNLHAYLPYQNYRRFRVPATAIDSAGRCVINSLWAVGSYCYFAENADSPSSVYVVNIMGEDEPLQTYVNPYGLEMYSGDVMLETWNAE